MATQRIRLLHAILGTILLFLNIRLAAAQLFSAAPVPTAPIGTITAAQLEVDWTSAARNDGAAESSNRYDLWIWNSFTGEVTQPSVVGALAYALDPATIALGVPYSVWVRASDVETGEMSDWSEPIVFSLPPDSAPVLGTPQGELMEAPTFTWTYSGAIAPPVFDLMVVNTATGEQLLKMGVASGYQPSGNDTLPQGYCYQWWVRATEAASGSASDWSSTGSFCWKMDNGSVPTPLTPNSGLGDASGGPYTPTFTWSFPSADANTRYDLYIQGQGTAKIIVKYDILGTTYTLAGGDESLQADVSCIWWVRAKDSVGGGATDWSEPSYFNTVDIPTVKSLLGLTNGPTEDTVHLKLDVTHPHYINMFGMTYDAIVWNPATGGQTDEEGNSGTQLSSSTREVTVGTPLAGGYTYTYYVRLCNTYFQTEGAWSEAATFRAQLYGDAVPLLSTSGTVVELDPLLGWTFDGGNANTRFDLYLTDTTTGESVTATTASSDTTVQASALSFALLDGHDYQLWVRSHDSVGGGTGPWSDATSFSVRLLP